MSTRRSRHSSADAGRSTSASSPIPASRSRGWEGPRGPTRSLTAVTTAELWRRGQEGWPRRFPVAQFPNPPLLVALAGWIVARVTSGSGHDYARATFYAGLAVWACLELTKGGTLFRRLPGAAGLVYVAVKVAATLG